MGIYPYINFKLLKDMPNGNRRKRGIRRAGSSVCKCPRCGHSEPHRRGIPCFDLKCPKCGTPMRGENCIDE